MASRRKQQQEPSPSADWTVLADVVLQSAALMARIGRDRAPDPLAGLRIDDSDVEALLAELPGLEATSIQIDPGYLELIEGSVSSARDEFFAALEVPTVFSDLVANAGLDRIEAEVLALLCAVELDPRRQRLVGYLNDDVTARRLTPWTLASLLDRKALEAVSPGGGLRRAALLSPPGSGPWSSDPLAVAPAVMWWLAGDHSPDGDLPPGVEIVAGEGGDHTLVVAAGRDRVRRLQAATSRLKPRLHMAVPIPETAPQWEAVIRWATLSGSGVILEAGDTLPSSVRDRIERARHLAWGITSAVELPISALPRQGWHEIEVDPPEATSAEWAATFDDAEIRNRTAYRLSADQLLHVGRAARALDGDVGQAVRRLAAGHIDATASRIRPTRGWDDLILDDDRMERIREVAMRCRRRDVVFGEWGLAPQPSTGVVALFAGPSGTGKTLAAEVIAADLGVDLYKVDLANLVSKYIGETEKNLSAVFDAAEASNVALFFDEADALLGKRSEVSDAHDRYANIEVAYLLQRLERYEGLAIMATNLVNNIDPAFLRRIHVIVDFPLPEAGERRKIWARCLPKDAPVAADLDLDALADGVEVSGGTIRNAVTTAAFLAADSDSAITMDHALSALRRELQKIGRLVDPSAVGGRLGGR